MDVKPNRKPDYRYEVECPDMFIHDTCFVKVQTKVYYGCFSSSSKVQMSYGMMLLNGDIYTELWTNKVR